MERSPSTIRLETRISASPEVCFNLARNVEVHMASTARSGEKVVGGVASGLIGPGEEVTWEARHFGVRFRMTARITEFDSPNSFTDEQVTGPFAVWRHRHTFDLMDGDTRMIDDVSYEVPFGLIGRLVDRFALNRYLTKLLRSRADFIMRAAERR